MEQRREIEENCVLAMYDIRGKQDFIFRSTKMKEIIGGSAIIRDCFQDYLIADTAKTYGKGIFSDNDVPFTRENFIQHIKDGYIGEVVYEGGGNFILLYKDEETCKNITYAFTKQVIRETATLKVICTYIKNVDFNDYQGDRKRLYEKHRGTEARLAPVSPYASAPIVQADYQTSMPLVQKYVRTQATNEIEKVTRECVAKYEKYEQQYQKSDLKEEQRILDKIVTEKGVESLLAVVYIDGNSMGAKVQNCLNGQKSYEECVAELRKFSMNIQKNYIDDRRADIIQKLKEKYPDDKMRRFVVYAGDEINFICNARDAFELATLYLNNLPADENGECTSCAGIAIFHSHAPYADAYRIAEECCESGKSRMKELELENISYLDFHYCQGAIGTSLEDIRDEEVGEFTSKPWAISGSDMHRLESNDVTIDDVIKMRDFLRELGHSNVKGLAEKAKNSMAEFKLELYRIKAHMDDDKREKLQENFEWIEKGREKTRALIYDMVLVYDLWFKKEGRE